MKTDKNESLENLLIKLVSDHLEAPRYDLSQIFITPDHSDYGYNFNIGVNDSLKYIVKKYFQHEKINPTNLFKIIMQSVVNNISSANFNASKAKSEIEGIIAKYRSIKRIIAFPIANMIVKKNIKFFEYTIGPTSYMKKRFPKMRIDSNSDCHIFIEDFGDLDFLNDYHKRRIESRLGYFKFFLSTPNTISSIQIASKYELLYSTAYYSDKQGFLYENLSPLPQKFNSIHDIFKDRGIKRFYKFLNTNKDISSLIFASLAWYCETLNPVSKEIKIISLCSSLESLFGFKFYPSSTGVKIVEISNLIYNGIIDKKSKIYKDVDRLKEIRNNIIHTTTMNQITSDDLKYFCNLVKNIIEGTMAFIKKHKILNQNEFNKKIVNMMIDAK
ncbi:MAG: hypothetical protein AB2L13_01145 [Spirochaetota bacterium]